MIRPLLSVALLTVFPVAFAGAAETAPYHHMHLTATNAAEGAAWYARHIDPSAEPANNRVTLFGTLFVFFEKEEGFPKSEGTGVDHIGFSFADLDAKMKELEEAGIKVLQEVRDVQGLFKYAFIEDPWGTKIEVMEDPDLVGFHHIHLRTPDPDATFSWYESAFGGSRAEFKDLLPGLRYGDLWLLAMSSGDDAPEPTIGTAIDHLGWAFADLEAAAVRLKGQGVRFTMEPRPFRNLKIAFVEDPDGVRIELVQPAEP